MDVETYEAIETTIDGIETSDEAIALIEQLGLEGQKSLLVKDEDGNEDRIPYRQMTRQEKRIYEFICPSKTELSKYSESPIPVRVMQVAAHAQQYFDHLMVWHPEGNIKDPVLVGIKGSQWSGEIFILARWGECLDSLDNLAKLACNICKAKYITKLEEIMAEAKEKIAEYKAMTPEGFTYKSSLNSPSLYL